MLATALAGACAGPIETRIETSGTTAPDGNATFTLFADESGSSQRTLANDLVSSALTRRGYRQADAATWLVRIGLAERSADLGLSTDTKNGKTAISSAKQQEWLQNCADREHRITIDIVNIADGAAIYSGTASEYHCHATMTQSLPHLVDAAMRDFGNPAGSYRRTRNGLE